MPTKDESELDSVTLLSKRQVAAALGVSAETLSDWVAAGRFPRGFATVTNGPLRWTTASVRDWIEKRQRSRAKRTKRGQLRRGKWIPRFRPRLLPRMEKSDE
jgi:predicted DNA-binding transcriptional regulator AlpA